MIVVAHIHRAADTKAKIMRDDKSVNTSFKSTRGVQHIPKAKKQLKQAQKKIKQRIYLDQQVYSSYIC